MFRLAAGDRDRACRISAHVLIGEDPAHIEKLWQKMQIAMMGHGMLGTVGGGAMTGIDMALWDIKGKALGVPVWQLLGGKMRDRIRIYTHANTPEVALSAKARGFTTIKCGGVVGSGAQGRHAARWRWARTSTSASTCTGRHG